MYSRTFVFAVCFATATIGALPARSLNSARCWIADSGNRGTNTGFLGFRKSGVRPSISRDGLPFRVES